MNENLITKRLAERSSGDIQTESSFGLPSDQQDTTAKGKLNYLIQLEQNWIQSTQARNKWKQYT